jgi:shikimate dehydrogenase
VPSDQDIVINATPLGKAGDPLPLDVSKLTSGMHVADVILKPHRTALLEEAEKRGCTIQHGIEMLNPQAELFYNYLVGREVQT